MRFMSCNRTLIYTFSKARHFMTNPIDGELENTPPLPPIRSNWREVLKDEIDPDDELLDETPPDVIQVLGFDPLDMD